MIEIAKLSADDRRELFHNTAAKIGNYRKGFLGVFDARLSISSLPVERSSHFQRGHQPVKRIPSD